MMVIVAVAALLFFGWTVYGAIRIAADAYAETAADSVRFDDEELLDLIAEKRAALDAIKTSELDFDTGKVAEEDFAEVKERASDEAIEVMRRLDEVRAGFRHQALVDRDLEALRQEREAMSGRTAPAPTESGDLWLSDEVAVAPDGLSAAAQARLNMRRQATADAPARTCGACGSALESDDKFCAVCGEGVRPTCTVCGVELHPGAKFCHECGERIAASREVV